MANGRDESETTHRFYRARTLRALGEAVRGARTARGLSQTGLADVIDASRPTISRLERGIPVTTDTVLAALAECGYELVAVPRGSVVRVTA